MGAPVEGGGRNRMRAWYCLMIAAVLVNATFETMLLPALPLIQADLELAPSQVGLVYAAYSLAAAIWPPVAGKCGDIFGARRLITTTLFLLTLGTLLPVSVHSFAELIVSQRLVRRLGLGFGELAAFRFIERNAVMRDVHEEVAPLY